MRREHNDRMAAAWWAGSLPNMKDPPRLDKLLVEVEPKRRKSWQDIKAALLFAMPPKGNG